MSIEIRPVAAGEYERAWQILAELRPALTLASFESGLAEQQRRHAYELLGAYEEGRLVAVMGIREVHTFARGPHLHVDDLVVASGARGIGIGRRLIEHAERLARGRGLDRVFLDSRPGAVGFYERRGYRRHESVLVKRRIDGAD